MDIHDFLKGKLETEVTSITLVNNTAKTELTTVPSGEKWLLLSVHVTNPDDVQRTINGYIWLQAAKTNRLKYLFEHAAGAGWPCGWPHQATANSIALMSKSWGPVVLPAGYTIDITWGAGGASSGGTDATGMVIQYLKVPT